jgi:hypothetical protein
MKYEQAKARIFAVGRASDGYNNTSTPVGFALAPVSGGTYRVLAVHDAGYYNAMPLLVTGEPEAFWLLNHHPEARAFSRIKLGTSHA